MNAEPPDAVGSIEPRSVLPTAALKPKGYTHKLIEIRCTTWDLGERPVADGRAQERNIHLQEVIAERRIRWGPPQFKPKRRGERGGDGEQTAPDPAGSGNRLFGDD